MAVLGIVCAFAYLLRASLATILLHAYLAGQGVQSQINVDSIGLDGITASGSLGPRHAPEVTFGRIAIKFDPQNWLPIITEIEIQRPTVLVAMSGNGISFGSLDPWIDAQRRQSVSSTGYPSFVSNNLAIDVVQARLLAKAPEGAMEIDGNARIEGGKPQRIDAVIRPARLRDGSLSANIEGGALKATASPSGIRLHASLSGDLAAATARGPVHVDGARVSLDIPALRWKSLAGQMSVSAASAMLSVDVHQAYRQEVTPGPLSLHARLANVVAGIADGHLRSTGDVEVAGTGSLSRADATFLVASVPLLGSDRRTADAFVAAFRDLALNAQLSWRISPKETTVTLAEPAQLSGAGPLVLRLSPVPGGTALRFSPSGISGSLAASLSGRDVPNVAFAVPAFSWGTTGGALDGVLGLTARFDFGSFHGVTVSGQVDAKVRNGVFQLDLKRCADLRMTSLILRRKKIASDTSAKFCADSGQPLFTASRTGWTLRGVGQNLSTNLDAAGARASGGSGHMTINGSSAGLQTATVNVAATLSDRAKARRFTPESVAGNIELAGGTAHGHFDFAAGPRHIHIGMVDFTHRIKTGTGYATIDFPAIAFDTKGLQPADLSPLLSALAQANGSARFAGRLDWTTKRINSRGRLDVDKIRFTSPLGIAEQLRTHMVFTSLLPPATAPNQPLDIARVNWMLPLTDTRTSVSYASSQIDIASAKTQIAGGEISLTPFSIALKSGMSASAVVRLSHVDLGALIATSNLGSKMHLDGKVSGTIPFSIGPAGLRFTGGRIESDGPGRLSLDRSLWGQSEPNAAEKFAYQALENLALDAFSATIDSEAHGRLRIVFHLKGYSDSPTTTAPEVGLFDLLRGTAFQKNIPLPRGTPVDLTLDTSLNFDELLRGYESAWSQVTAQAR